MHRRSAGCETGYPCCPTPKLLIPRAGDKASFVRLASIADGAVRISCACPVEAQAQGTLGVAIECIISVLHRLLDHPEDHSEEQVQASVLSIKRCFFNYVPEQPSTALQHVLSKLLQRLALFIGF